MRGTLVLCALATLVATFPGACVRAGDEHFGHLFPVPHTVSVASPTTVRQLADTFTIVSAPGTENEIVTLAARRYLSQGFIPLPTSRLQASKTVIERLVVHVDEPHITTPTLKTDVSYQIAIKPGNTNASITARSPFGALNGIETFSQLVGSAGGIPGDGITISDAPNFIHRGLTVDVGRRISPVKLIESIIDGLAFTKMNVLHLSLTGPAMRVQLDAFPELTSWLEPGQYYTKEQVAGFVEYARVRGVIIVPEIDIPAHASGFWPMTATRALQFCDQDRTTIANDEHSISLVKAVFDEMAPLFTAGIFHIGGDEALPKGNCTFESIHDVERQVQEHLISSHGLRPMAWNEVFSSPTTSEPNAAIPGHTILQNWKGTGDANTIDAGFVTVDSQYQVLYLNEQCCRVNPDASNDPHARYKQCFYTDPLRTLSPAQRSTPAKRNLLAGAEAAMWSDEYCPTPLCAMNGTYGWMQPPAMDDIFTLSFGRQVFPNAAGTGAALWNFLNTSTSSFNSVALSKALGAHNDRLTSRHVVTCPSGCHCDWGQSCGKPYDPTHTGTNLHATLVNKCSFPVKVRKMQPCNRTGGPTIAMLQPGDSVVVHDDFEVLASTKPYGLLIGDPFDLWVGDSTWMDIYSEFHITWDESIPHNSYLAMTQIGSSAAPAADKMHVVLHSAIEGHHVIVHDKSGEGPATLCNLAMVNASCLVGKDFIAELLDPTGMKVIASSDQFSSWVGGPSWRSTNISLVVARSGTSSYLSMSESTWRA